MKKQIAQVVASLVLAAPLSMFAQDLDSVKVNVPFAFKAGSVSMPAGDYRIVESNDAGLIRIVGEKSGAMFITTPGHVSANDANALEFEQTKVGAVLKEVRTSNRAAFVLPAQE